MAKIKLQELAEKTTAADTDIMILEDATATKKITISNLLKGVRDLLTNLTSAIGTLTSLTTTQKNTLVGAVNEVDDRLKTVEANNSLLHIGASPNLEETCENLPDPSTRIYTAYPAHDFGDSTRYAVVYMTKAGSLHYMLAIRNDVKISIKHKFGTNAWSEWKTLG